jgi:hypothetical protein
MEFRSIIEFIRYLFLLTTGNHITSQFTNNYSTFHVFLVCCIFTLWPLTTGTFSVIFPCAMTLTSVSQLGKLLLALTSTVILGFGYHWDPWPNICSLQEPSVFWNGAPSLTIGGVRLLLSSTRKIPLDFGSGKFLLGLVSTVIVGSESWRSHDHIFLS